MSLGFPTSSDTNRAVQLQKAARGLKIQVQEEEGLHYLNTENKRADQVNAQLIFAFDLAYAKSRFSHDMAHLISSFFFGFYK